MTGPVLERSHASALTAHLGFWLRAVSNQVSQAFANRLAGQGVTVAEWVLMRSMYDLEPVTPSHLADALGMTRGAITKLVDRLIAKDFAVRERNSDDGRSQTLALTQQGQAMVPELAALADENDAAFFHALTRQERDTMEQLLKRLLQGRGVVPIPID